MNHSVGVRTIGKQRYTEILYMKNGIRCLKKSHLKRRLKIFQVFEEQQST